jgi:hypothetical protein
MAATARGGHDPLASGLFRKLVARNYTVDADAWRHASNEGELVGQCRRPGCGGYLTVDQPQPYPGVDLVWYLARCLKCDNEVAAPGGRVLRRSGRHHEAPDFWAQRTEQLKRNDAGR